MTGDVALTLQGAEQGSPRGSGVLWRGESQSLDQERQDVTPSPLRLKLEEQTGSHDTKDKDRCKKISFEDC